MPDNELFTKALSLEKPWYVKDLKFDPSGKRLNIYIGGTSDLLPCPVYGKPCVDYDSMEREWRHLDFFQYETHIHARIPVTNCKVHGIKAVNVSWSRKDSNFSMKFEHHALDYSKEMPVPSASEFLKTTQDSVWRILKHYVDQARKIMVLSGIVNMGVDEIAIRKGHNYETIFYDHEERRVLHIEMGKKNTAFRKVKKVLPEPEKVKNGVMDMEKWYILGLTKYFPKSRIIFDHFHVIKRMNNVVDMVRRREQKKNPVMKSTGFIWLKNCSTMAPQGEE